MDGAPDSPTARWRRFVEEARRQAELPFETHRRAFEDAGWRVLVHPTDPDQLVEFLRGAREES